MSKSSPIIIFHFFWNEVLIRIPAYTHRNIDHELLHSSLALGYCTAFCMIIFPSSLTLCIWNGTERNHGIGILRLTLHMSRDDVIQHGLAWAWDR